ncbi:hypothetical protein ACF1BU_13940 [Streptomyces sp. NPDC014724]|uniref:hypothetical protein n=1 Tax=unclassified Streptomyces TaxID=2593676 RepID=UPI0036FFDCC4
MDGTSRPQDEALEHVSGQPLLGEEEFWLLVNGLVAETAPRVFAVVQEYGDHEDGWVAAWGLAFEDRAEVIRVDCGARMSVRSPESALRYFRSTAACVPRVVWAPVIS